MRFHFWPLFIRFSIDSIFFQGGELIALIALVPAIVIGLAAAKYGDSFWQWLSRNWRWWI
jgi:hypothetical protein